MSLQYVYGIVPASAAAAIDAARIEGIDGTAVHAVVAGQLAAVVGAMSEDEYESRALNERVRDLEWLTPRAAEHQAVNSRLLELAPAVLPVSFGALYRDEARVREMLHEDAAARTARLEELAGRGEWIVTVSREVDAPAGADAELRRSMKRSHARRRARRSSWNAAARARRPPRRNVPTMRPRAGRWSGWPE